MHPQTIPFPFAVLLETQELNSYINVHETDVMGLRLRNPTVAALSVDKTSKIDLHKQFSWRYT